MCPERDALSIVEGQSVEIQSPAMKQFGHAGRHSKRGANFLHECRFLEFCRANLRKKLSKFPYRLLNGLFACESGKPA
jgi:hypothetical protein